MSKTLAILGAGELGKQIANFAVNDHHYSSVLFYDDISKEQHITGTSEILLSDYENKKFDDLIIGIGYNHLEVRKQKFDLFHGKIPFGKIIHSTSWIDPKATVNSGTVIYPGCCIDASVVIGHNTLVNLACTISHDTHIGNHSFLAPRVAVAGFVKIGECCFLGINSTIIDSVTVVGNTNTGGGAVVIKNITEPGLYVGNPVNKIK